ncbi:MAG TPA: hypothetical protein VHP36_07980 [Chitinispirillaceae bacterium]|nr:hypothetical protein [Chitinispirillaceae bacterium]
MSKLFLSVVIGIFAGAIDVLPMIAQKLDRYSNISAFIQWIIVSFVITHIEFGIHGWLKGLTVAVLMSIPIIILVMKADMKSIVPILLMSAVLGSLVGLVSDKLVK